MALPEPSGGSALTTTGQLDWFALSRMPISTTLEAAKRFFNAGVEILTVGIGSAICSSVEGLTVCIGSAICSSFSFPPEGQQELFSSLNALKGFPPFSDLLYFGFGLKHLVRTLAESEQGATLVALCAALATPYGHSRASHIFWELSKQTGAPSELTPSIHQWSDLVNVCANSLIKSHFHDTFHHFAHLLAPNYHWGPGPATAEAVAKALLVLAKLSRGLVDYAVFAGGLDCALLAAIAQCLLRLSVEIRDENQDLLFSSSSQTTPQAIFIRESTPTDGVLNSSNLAHRLYFLTSGGTLLKFSDHDYHSPTRWETVLGVASPEWSAFYNPSLAKRLSGFIADEAVGSPTPGSAVKCSSLVSHRLELTWLAGGDE